MRYGNDVGYVWLTIARHRDLVARALGPRIHAVIAYPQLHPSPAYVPQWLTVAQADFYDYGRANRHRLAAFIKQHGIRLVVFMSAPASAVDLSFLRRLGVRTVVTENDSFDHRRRQSTLLRIAKFLIRGVLRRQLHGLHVANSQSQYAFLRRTAQIPATRLAINRDGVDGSRYTPGDRRAARAAIGLDPDCLWVMAAGQARPEKRVDRIIAAIGRCIDARPTRKIGFLYVGDGACLPQWRLAAAAIGRPERFHFAGQQSALCPYYQAASLFAHAAVRESFGLVLVEAMLCGLPVVSCHAAGPDEIVIDGETGVLVDANDATAYEQALLAYLDDPPRRQAHGEAGRRRALDCFSIDRQALDFADLLRTQLGICPPP